MKFTNVVAALTVAAMFVAPAQAERVKDLATVAGVRGNQLVGYGLVVGLDGTGDQTSQAPFTIQSIRNMLAKFGVTIPANVNPQLKNVAAVTVRADLPAFSKPGQTIDITVDSIGNATSLRGGSLIMTPLRGIDGEVYAIGQGSLVVSGFGVQGKDGSRISINVPSSGRVPNGASVERSVPTNFASEPYVSTESQHTGLHHCGSFDGRHQHHAGSRYGSRHGCGVGSCAGADRCQSAHLVSLDLEAIEIQPGEAPARVIVNSRTGTVVIGSAVRVTPAAVAHGSLSVTITERSDVSQPGPLSNGQTVVTPRSEIKVDQPEARMFVFNAGVNLDEIVRAVNQVGAAPGDLVAILEALKEAGALRAELIVI